MSDRIRTTHAALLRQAEPRLDFFALYPARIVAQDGDVLDVMPDDPRMPPLRAPIRLGIPNATCKVTPGSRVLIGFENADPSKPIATLWDSSTIIELVIADGTAGAARVGDRVVGTAGPYTVNAQIVSGSTKVRIG